MRAGRVEEAGAMAKKVGDIIKRRCKSRLSNINGRVDPKKMWAEVRKLNGHKQEAPVVDGQQQTLLTSTTRRFGLVVTRWLRST